MTGKKILFVDDEELIRKLVTTYLERLGYVVKTATDGAQALRAITADPPDLVITDVQLPSLSGLELTRRLRANHRTLRLPIIMLSAHNETDDVLAGYGQGADEYVSKPVELAVLGAKVEVLLRRANANGMEPKPGKRGVVIAFLHGKGGVGTTTLAVNTAILLARSETSSAVLVDLNRDYANADMLLDLHPGHRLDELARYNLDELEQTTFAEFLTPYSDGLSILAGPASPEAGEGITEPIARFAVERSRTEADYIMVDLAASFSDVNLAVIDAADAVCIVTSADMAALKATSDCLRIVDRMDVIPRERMLLVLNRTTTSGISDDRAATFLGYTPDVFIPNDAKLQQAGDEGRPFVTSRQMQPSGRAIVDLADKLAAFRAEKRHEQLVWGG